MEKMHEISFGKINDGSIRLEQQSGVDDPNVILLHPEQLNFIVRRTTGMAEIEASHVEDLERRLGVLAAGLTRFVCDSSTRREILDCCGSGFEFISKLDGLLNLAWEYDGGSLLPEDMDPSDGPGTKAVLSGPGEVMASPVRDAPSGQLDLAV